MKLTAIILLATALQVSANGYSQKVSLSVKDGSLKKVFWQIKKQTGYLFFCNADWLQKSENVTIQVKDVSIEEALEIVFRNQPLEYSIVNKTVVIRLKKETPALKLLPAVIERIIKGKISDEKGLPLAGASVKIKGAKSGTYTNENGEFFIEVDEKSVLVISYVGYKQQEIVADSAAELTVKLVASSSELTDVVVVAYGTQKKTSLTAAVSTIKGSEIAALPIANLTNAIGGRVPGVIFRQNSGEPGFDGASLLIRGIGTTGATAPLVVVDGVPRSMGQLDPNSVASITFLKDAAAVAPYGVAGANGVILITTIKGNSGKPVLVYNAYYGLQNPTRLPDMVDAYEYVTMRNVANANASPPQPPVYTAEEVEKFRNGSDPDRYPNHDVLGEMINKNTKIMGHNLSISGGSEKIKYFGSLGYLDQDGMWGPTNFKRYNLLSNIEAQPTATTKFSISLNGRIEDKRFPAISAASIFDQLYRTPPIAPLTFSNGLWGSYIGRSAYGNVFKSGYSNSLSQVLLTQVSLEQQLSFIKGLSARVVFSYDFNEPAGGNDRSTNKTWRTPIPYYTVNTSTTPYTYPQAGTDGPAKPNYTVSLLQSQAFTYQGYLNYNNRFGKHDIGGTLVLESRNTKLMSLMASRTNFNVSVPELSNGSFNATDISNSGFSSEAKQRGLIFRTTYAYDDKYLFEASGRYDGHYAFAPGKRYSLFPAVSVGWRASEEKFISSNMSWIDNLKFRASYGESGALPSGGAFQYISAYALYGNSAVLATTGTQGLRELLEPNKNITWEKAKKTNIGFELSIFNGLFYIEADYFTEKRNDMLVSPQILVPAEYGIGIAQENAAAMKNKGFEFIAGSNYTVNKDLKLSLTTNFTYAKNKLVQVFEGAATFNNPNRRITGRPLGYQFGYNALGLFQQSDDKNGNGTIESSEYDIIQFGTLRPGDIRYEDVNGDKKITPEDFKPIGKSATPEIIYGFSPAVVFKGFDLNLLFQGAANRHFYINGQAAWPFSNSGSALKATLDYWTPENTDAKYPRVTSQPTSNNIQTSSWWIKSGSYLRLKSAEIGYTLPAKIISVVKMQSARFYLSGQNIFTISKEIKDFDPEISANNGNYYPQQSVISAGVNITF